MSKLPLSIWLSYSPPQQHTLIVIGHSALSVYAFTSIQTASAWIDCGRYFQRSLCAAEKDYRIIHKMLESMSSMFLYGFSDYCSCLTPHGKTHREGADKRKRKKMKTYSVYSVCSMSLAQNIRHIDTST